MGKPLENKIRTLLRERWWYEMCAWRQYGKYTIPRRANHNGWQDLNRRLYATVAEVNKKLGKGRRR